MLLLVLALALHVAVGVPYAASGLVVPEEVVPVLWALWAALLVVLVLVWRRRPGYALGVPVLAVALLLATVTAGDLLLGWTA